jgi:LPXTG-site transpeptidase (sortase) family protein
MRLALVLACFGGTCIVTALLLVASATWNEHQHAASVASGPPEPPPKATPPGEPTPEPYTTPLPTVTPLVATLGISRPTPTPVLPPTAQPEPPAPATPQPVQQGDELAQAPDYGPPRWMRIPRIGLDNQVVPVGVADGAYEASWWDIGHQVDSPDPGSPGNSVFNGHVATINAGHVFRRLKELGVGDTVFVYSDTHRTEWSVVDVFDVAADARDFMQQTDDTRITLYTCDGHWNPLRREFSERRVVVAAFRSASELD